MRIIYLRALSRIFARYLLYLHQESNDGGAQIRANAEGLCFFARHTPVVTELEKLVSTVLVPSASEYNSPRGEVSVKGKTRYERNSLILVHVGRGSN